MPSIFPDNVWVTMKYSDTYDFNLLPGAAQSRIFRANSIFDPDVTGTGSVAMGYDLYNRMYNRYMVYASSIKVAWMNDAANQGEVWIRPSDQQVVVNDLVYIQNLPYSSVRVLGDRAGPLTVHRHRMASKKFYGHRIDNDLQNFSAAFSNNPTFSLFWHVGILATFAAMSARCQVTIYYKVRCFRREWEPLL